MSDGRRGRRGRQRITRPLDLKCDASLSQYFSFFWSLPTRQNGPSSWEDSQYLDSEKAAFGCEGVQDLVDWENNQVGKVMGDQVTAADNNKSPYAALEAQYSGGVDEVGTSKQGDCSQPYPAAKSPSLSRGSINGVLNAIDGFSAANGTKTPAGAKQLCVICGGQANGYHFGALSCAACNAFFRRSVAEKRKYFCRKSGNCVIDQTARCFCRACRLTKCMDCGMDPNAVQPHRDMIGQKRKRSTDEGHSDSMNSGLDMNNGSEAKDISENNLTNVGLADGLSRTEQEEQFRSSNNIMTIGHNLVEPCNVNLQHAFSQCNEDGSKRPKYADSATAHLLTSTYSDILAESLIAFSRAPLIGSAYSDLSNGIPNVVGCNQINSTKPEVVDALPLLKVTPDSVVRSAQNPLLVGLSSHLSQAGEEQKAYNPDHFLPCVNPPQLVQHFGDSINNGASSSGDWVHESDNSSFFWNATSSQPKETSPSTSRSDYDASKNIIEILVDGYRKLRERRRLLSCPPTLRDMLGGTEAPLRSVPFGVSFQALCRIDSGLLVEFFNLIYPFSKLRLEDRIMLVKNAAVAFCVMEKYYVTMRGGGFQANRIINNDNSYHDLSPDDDENSDSVVETNSFERPVNTGKDLVNDYRLARRLLIPELRDALRDIAGGMHHSGMSDVEFVALAAIILLDHSAPNLSDVARRLVKEARDHLYLDWFAYYDAHHISDASQKVGNALLLLPAIFITSKKESESYHLVRVFNLFEITSLIDDVMK